MLEWTAALITTAVAIFFGYMWSRAADQRDRAIRAVQMVEMEYRLMSQSAAIFDKLDETRNEMAKHRDAREDSNAAA